MAQTPLISSSGYVQPPQTYDTDNSSMESCALRNRTACRCSMRRAASARRDARNSRCCCINSPADPTRRPEQNTSSGKACSTRPCDAWSPLVRTRHMLTQSKLESKANALPNQPDLRRDAEPRALLDNQARSSHEGLDTDARVRRPSAGAGWPPHQPMPPKPTNPLRDELLQPTATLVPHPIQSDTKDGTTLPTHTPHSLLVQVPLLGQSRSTYVHMCAHAMQHAFIQPTRSLDEPTLTIAVRTNMQAAATRRHRHTYIQ